jgi:hypothetical protein
LAVDHHRAVPALRPAVWGVQKHDRNSIVRAAVDSRKAAGTLPTPPIQQLIERVSIWWFDAVNIRFGHPV